MCSPVPGGAEGYLHDPTFRRALVRTKENRFLVEAKEDFLNDIFGFITVVQNAKSDSQYQTGISSEEQVQGFRIFDLEASHEFFIARRPNLDGLGRRDGFFRNGPPDHGECQRAPIQRRAHLSTLTLPRPDPGTR